MTEQSREEMHLFEFPSNKFVIECPLIADAIMTVAEIKIDHHNNLQFLDLFLPLHIRANPPANLGINIYSIPLDRRLLWTQSHPNKNANK